MQTDKRKGNKPMKEQIKELLAHHPNGLRLREIAMYLRVNRFSIIDILDDMKKEGIIDGRSNDDHANGEYYILWYIK
jgi:DNA-binding IclR family transcriptional regulator